MYIHDDKKENEDVFFQLSVFLDSYEDMFVGM